MMHPWYAYLGQRAHEQHKFEDEKMSIKIQNH